jgi:methyltransferase family protein
MDYKTFVEDTVARIKELPQLHSPLVASIPFAKDEGLWLEFGVYQGKSIKDMGAAAMRARVYGFDSFQGLPEDWIAGLPKGCFATAVPPVPPGVNPWVIGMFEDTLPQFKFDAPVNLLHVDSDIYSSATTVFKYVQPHLAPNAIVVFDELWDYEGFEGHEMKALYETGLKFELLHRGPSQHNPRGQWNGRVSMRLVS